MHPCFGLNYPHYASRHPALKGRNTPAQGAALCSRSSTFPFLHIPIHPRSHSSTFPFVHALVPPRIRSTTYSFHHAIDHPRIPNYINPSTPSRPALKGRNTPAQGAALCSRSSTFSFIHVLVHPRPSVPPCIRFSIHPRMPVLVPPRFQSYVHSHTRAPVYPCLRNEISAFHISPPTPNAPPPQHRPNPVHLSHNSLYLVP